MMREHYNQTGYQVAVHVRRGDVYGTKDDASKNRRFAKDEVYLEVVRQVKARARLSCFSMLTDSDRTMELAGSNSSKKWDVSIFPSLMYLSLHFQNMLFGFIIVFKRVVLIF